MMETYNEAHIRKQLQKPESRTAAFEQIVRQYSEPLYWQIRRMTDSHDDADDVLQNTFIKAWTHLDDFRGEAKLSTWLYRIALNETLNFLQRKKISVRLDADTETALGDRLATDPYFDGDETERRLQQAIDLLPDKQRMVFTLKYFQEMKYEEMSDVLQTSVGALKASYHHAVKKIYEFFNRHD